MRSKFSHHRCEKENLQHQTSILMSETMWTKTTETLVISIVNYRNLEFISEYIEHLKIFSFSGAVMYFCHKME